MGGGGGGVLRVWESHGGWGTDFTIKGLWLDCCGIFRSTLVKEMIVPCIFDTEIGA